ncbi:DUF4398 domain-containing protein [Xanthomonas sp. XNM01]|uniref:DUF4398 domain-containing protein n=1 Tax=Xanthomonas sp. XNM01 TaxID=2769289 RepID=UPI0017814EE7|nr:DUF4398 domain-containing protein [Xanthomonas sp. XNM01]MBD9369590.1 DUF4398 domain-containing protein [Xanthomonas sp. XNM01]
MNLRSFAYFTRRLCALALASGLAVTAHAQVLAPEIVRAEQALMQARDAYAGHYVPDLMEQAEDGLRQAQAGIQSRSRNDRRQAADLALRAAADAELARARSLQIQAEATLLQRQTEIADLRRQLGLGGTP